MRQKNVPARQRAPLNAIRDPGALPALLRLDASALDIRADATGLSPLRVRRAHATRSRPGDPAESLRGDLPPVAGDSPLNQSVPLAGLGDAAPAPAGQSRRVFALGALAVLSSSARPGAGCGARRGPRGLGT